MAVCADRISSGPAALLVIEPEALEAGLRCSAALLTGMIGTV
jgi:hypothetical protein